MVGGGGLSALVASLFLHRRFGAGARLHWPVLLGAAGSFLLLQAFGRVKVGVVRRQWGADAPNGGRRLGLLERWYVAHSRSGTHTGFCLCMELEAPAEGAPTIGELRRRLFAVSQRFSWLRRKVRRDGVNGVDSRISLDRGKALWGDDLYVIEMAELCQPSTRTVMLQEQYRSPCAASSGLRRILEEESVKIWHDEDPSKPLWRVTLVKWEDNPSKFALVLSFHHILTDGMGALQVARAVCDRSRDDGTPVGASPADIPPPMEDVMYTVPSLSHMLLPVLCDRFPRIAAVLCPSHWRGNPVHRECSDDSERSTQLACITLFSDASQSAELRAFASKQGLSYNTVLMAALAKSVASVGCGRDRVCLQIQVPADQRRRRANVPYSDLGSYVTGPQFYLNVHKANNIVTIGRAVATRLRCALESAHMDIGLISFISGNLIGYFRQRRLDKPNGVNISLEISLLPGIADQQNGAWAVRNLWFVQGHLGLGPAVMVSVAGSGAGLNAALTSFPEVVSRKILGDIAIAWKHELAVVIHRSKDVTRRSKR